MNEDYPVEYSEAEERIENAKQAMSETHDTWKVRCFAIMGALGLDFGDGKEYIPDHNDKFRMDSKEAKALYKKLNGESLDPIDERELTFLRLGLKYYLEDL